MTQKYLNQLVKESDYPELQRLWKPDIGQEVFSKNTGYFCIVDRVYQGKYSLVGVTNGLMPQIKNPQFSPTPFTSDIWLPRIEDCIRLMGDKFRQIWRFGSFHNISNKQDKYVCDTKMLVSYTDKSPRLACLRALKSILRGEK
jgi:hypothetical protein